MSISKFSCHKRSIKLNFSVTTIMIMMMMMMTVDDGNGGNGGDGIAENELNTE